MTKYVINESLVIYQQLCCNAAELSQGAEEHNLLFINLSCCLIQ